MSTAESSPNELKSVKRAIVVALSHPEAEEGLYFRNFYHLHEEDERPAVEAPEEDIFEALKELLQEGRVVLDATGAESVFKLSAATH